jgi:hypothetical protein
VASEPYLDVRKRRDKQLEAIDTGQHNEFTAPFPHQDLGLQEALSVKKASAAPALSEKWHPW